MLTSDEAAACLGILGNLSLCSADCVTKLKYHQSFKGPSNVALIPRANNYGRSSLHLRFFFHLDLLLRVSPNCVNNEVKVPSSRLN